MHLSARLRVPLAGAALCSTALLISACGGSSGSGSKKVPTTAVAVVGTETVSKTKLDTLLAQVCVQYKAAKKACPKQGTAERKQLQQSFVAQLVQQAEFDVAGRQLGVAVKQKDIDSSLQKLELQYAKGKNGKVDQAKWKKVLTDNHTSESNVLDNIKDGLLRKAIYDKLTKNVAVNDAAVQTYYTKNKKTYATAASRAIRHILVKDKTLADKIYQQLATSDAQFAALAKKYTIDPGSKKNGGKLGTIQKGQTVPTFDKVAFSIPTGKVSKPVKSSYGWHVIEATGDTVPASQRPLDKALKTQIRTTLLTTQKQSIANKWFTTFQKKIEKTVRYAAGFVPAKTTSTAATGTTTPTAASTAAPATTTG
jgi:parvulin-like peptidyl-prolyl isomerase